MNDPLQTLLRQQNLNSPQEITKKVKAVLIDESVASRKVYETFHTNLALFSSGTMALSITYLGYLKSSGAHVIHVKTLVASWACLIAAIPLSLFFLICTLTISPMPARASIKLR